MKRRLIALMITLTIATSTLSGCGDDNVKHSVELENENEIREMLEYDANTNLSKENVEDKGFYLEYKIQNEKFYITFITKKWEFYGRVSQLEDDAKITYEVDKDMYYDFKNHYNLDEKTEDVERVKELVEKYDPVEVINPSINNIEK